MKKLLATLPLLAVYLCHAQSGPRPDRDSIDLIHISDTIAAYNARKLVEIHNDSAARRYFSKGAYDKFFDRFFSQFKYDRENFTDGNSASLKVTDNSTRLNLTFSGKFNNTILSVGTNLNVTDSTGVIFSKREPSAGTEIFGNISFIPPQLRKLGYDGRAVDKNIRKRTKLIDSIYQIYTQKNPTYYTLLKQKVKDQDSLIKRYDALLYKIKFRTRTVPAQYALGYLDREILEYDSLIMRLSNSVPYNLDWKIFSDTEIKDLVTDFSDKSKHHTPAEIKLYATVLVLAFLDKQYFAMTDSRADAIDNKQKAQVELESMTGNIIHVKQFTKELKKSVDKLENEKQLETNGVTSFRFFWFNAGLSYRRDEYQTYDSTIQFSKQVDKKNFDKWTFKAGGNFVWQRSSSWLDFLSRSIVSSIYANADFSLVKTNAFELLDEQTLSVKRILSQNDTSYQFGDDKKVRDISGVSFSPEWLKRVNMGVAMMFGKYQFFGLNLTGGFDFRDDRHTLINSHCGFLFRFKDSDDEKSIVNFELFMAFNDMTDTKGSGNSVWQGKEIGISASIPFSKVFFR